MNNQHKTRAELAAELDRAQRRIAQLETLFQLKESLEAESPLLASGPVDIDTLRQEAEAHLAQQPPAEDRFASLPLMELIHELQVHQIELEMQNEELRRAQHELNRTQQKYADLYTFAPVAYLTFDKNGTILDLNLMAGKLIDDKRQVLKNKPLLPYLGQDSYMTFQQHLHAALREDSMQTCELRLKRLSGQPLVVQAQSIAVSDDQGQRSLVWTTLSDISKLKQAEQTLIRQRNQLQSQSAALTAANEKLQEEIRQRKQITEALQQSETRFRTLVDSMDDIVFLLDKEGRHTAIFGRWLERLDLPAEFFMGKTSREIMGPEAAAPHEAANAKAFAGAYVIYDWTTPGPDGPQSFQTSLSPLYDEQREIIGLVGVGRDVTALKQTEAALRESETRYKNLVEGAPDIVYAYSTRRGGLYHSPRVKDILGYTPEQLQAKPKLWHDSIHPDDLSRVDQAIKATEAGDDFEIEYRITDVWGQEHWFLDRSIRRKQADGEVIIEGIAVDITARVETEKALQEEKERLNLVLQGAELGYWDWQVQTGQVTFNERWAEMLGQTLAEIEPHISSWEQLTHPDDMPQVMAAINDHLAGRTEFYESEHRLRTKTGDWCWVLDRGKVFERDEQDRPLRAVGIHQDITERKENETQLRHALIEKEVLLKEIHHRVKNNLQIISSLLSLQSQTTDDPHALAILKESHSRVRTMALIHEKLYRSDNLARVNFLAYAHDLVTNLFRSHQAYQRGIEFEISGDNVLLDINTLVPCGLIINELITNTLKHAFPPDQAGKIFIQISFVPDNTCQLVIADNGAGLSAPIEPTELEQSATLGLQLVYSLTQQLSGTININQENGTRFVIDFEGAVLANDN